MKQTHQRCHYPPKGAPVGLHRHDSPVVVPLNGVTGSMDLRRSTSNEKIGSTTAEEATAGAGDTLLQDGRGELGREH
ncbi:hypothetical protein E2562_015978 [Oryza meyeriana var. granulata]|uniref:Uncharacterized protein n=1 Tax=Oryza meyeriana var. granulata TaxID=110450 RepID=A0A6G1EKB6_9ORYZ|nr:hypothetical protein E2562_015978 [Oryza meyeriana var. granulata]